MINNDSFNADNTHNQFVISHELLALLQWLVEHDAERLKKIVSKAMSTGLREEIQRHKNIGESHIAEDIQHSIVEFFGLLESLLYETASEQAMQEAVEKNLMPAIDHIDSTICDNETIRFSVEKATSKLSRSPEENPQDVLFKELLRCWKPGNKKVTN